MKKKIIILLTTTTLMVTVNHLSNKTINTPAASISITKDTQDSKSEETDGKNNAGNQLFQLDVPLENQNSGDILGNGCEITALSMLLQFYDYDVIKNSLAAQLNYVPLNTSSGNRGNPHEGFVGNIYGGDLAMGVFVEPIAKVAEEVVGDDYEVKAGSGDLTFDEVLSTVASGAPVWIIATVDFVVPTTADFINWKTDDGTIKVSPLIHAAVVTGFDEDSQTVYVNDPYGIKNQAISYGDMSQLYEEMGSQALYLDAV